MAASLSAPGEVTGGFAAHSSAQHQGEHPEVAAQRPEGIGERRRPVLFDREVREPGESVREKGRERRVDRAPEDESGGYDRGRAGGPGEVEPSGGALRMLGDVEGPELLESRQPVEARVQGPARKTASETSAAASRYWVSTERTSCARCCASRRAFNPRSERALRGFRSRSAR